MWKIAQTNQNDRIGIILWRLFKKKANYGTTSFQLSLEKVFTKWTPFVGSARKQLPPLLVKTPTTNQSFLLELNRTTANQIFVCEPQQKKIGTTQKVEVILKS